MKGNFKFFTYLFCCSSVIQLIRRFTSEKNKKALVKISHPKIFSAKKKKRFSAMHG